MARACPADRPLRAKRQAAVECENPTATAFSTFGRCESPVPVPVPRCRYRDSTSPPAAAHSRMPRTAFVTFAVRMVNCRWGEAELTTARRARDAACSLGPLQHRQPPLFFRLGSAPTQGHNARDLEETRCPLSTDYPRAAPLRKTSPYATLTPVLNTCTTDHSRILPQVFLNGRLGLVD
ncbi:hypothetical protein FZEAL_10776 [Fusarium zealandicum]|uniref:Uncharacterized protein n=1 Tax=Fusarium zealandicum TaxID=1053134 RepID=A0A8H4TWA5_9HYPO|nr:hypothetical protein FZEAL_10776 [Fusarium zealandicum]